MAICQYKDLFTKCRRNVLEGDRDGLCLLHSRRIDKDQEGAFTRAIKEQISLEDFNFSGVFFPGVFSLEDLFGALKINKDIEPFAKFTKIAVTRSQWRCLGVLTR